MTDDIAVEHHHLYTPLHLLMGLRVNTTHAMHTTHTMHTIGRLHFKMGSKHLHTLRLDAAHTVHFQMSSILAYNVYNLQIPYFNGLNTSHNVLTAGHLLGGLQQTISTLHTSRRLHLLMGLTL